MIPVPATCEQSAVVVSEFGGDAVAPVWWRAPFLVVATSRHEQVRPARTQELTKAIGCDSATFVFVAMNDAVPGDLRRKIEADRSGALLELPAGRYRFYLEQFTPEDEHSERLHWYRNIVAQWNPR